ncbi:MAG: hypothetical protein J6T38_11455 [Bacteroidaceae bacterium]|nr:hypothetical protein [Bacteroidaceae bacterium]
MPRTMNEGLPPETTLRYVIQEKHALQVENGILKAENDDLKAEIERKDKAIAAFKKWQSRVAQYKFEYWMAEGMKLMEEQPEEKRFKEFRRIIMHYGRFRTYFRIAEMNYDLVQEDREKLKRLVEEDNDGVKEEDR